MTRPLVLEKCNGLTSAQWESIVKEDIAVGHFLEGVVAELRHKLSANACRLFKASFLHFVSIIIDTKIFSCISHD